MVHTLPEYAKGQSDANRAIIELFPEASDILGAIPFKTAPGGRYGYQREGALPNNMAFRGINETPGEGHGVINDLTEQCFPIAGNIDVDRALIRRHGSERRAVEERMSIKKKAVVWTDTFINGNNATEPREWTGLKSRLQVVGGSVDGSNYDSRIFANSTASGGAALSLAQLDRAIGLVENPTHILMPKAILDRFGAAQRDTGVSGFITWDKDEWGKRAPRYNGLPILTGYGITPHGAFLDFDEVAYGGGGAVTSSLYIVSFSEEGLCGLETAPMEVHDYGLLENGAHFRTNVEHDVGLCLEGAYAAMRMTSITNAAIVK
ncbi:MAG: putative major capsid protein [Prokaryotic dsDNA virus sp.]|nr:MAG: putative major capsid protein [Prokaryotic dsDNA virus sp.]